MIKEIVTNEVFLAQPSQPATKEDIAIAEDLLDTLKANSDRCVGLAANMIGALKRVIAADDQDNYLVMLNPEIVKASGAYQTEESCLSLVGTRPTKRYKSIKVQYHNAEMQTRIKTFRDFTAQIIQHEIDHCNGIMI